MLRFRPKRKTEPEAKPPVGEPAAEAPPTLPDHIQRPEVSDPKAVAPTPPTSPVQPEDRAGDNAAGDEDEQYEGYEAGEDPALRPIAADERAGRATALEFIRTSDGEFTREEVRDRIVDALQTIYDPEIPVDIYQLGLVYSIDIQPDGNVHVEMTLTSPACPVAGTLPPEVEAKVATCDGVDNAKVEVVWDPPWNPGMMTESARLELGFF